MSEDAKQATLSSLRGRVELQPFAAHAGRLGLAIAFAPRLVFATQLLRARSIGVRQCASLVTDYTRRFHERWVARVDHGDVLGTPDLHSLSDLGHPHQGTTDKVLFVLSPASEVINRIMGTVFCKMP